MDVAILVIPVKYGSITVRIPVEEFNRILLAADIMFRRKQESDLKDYAARDQAAHEWVRDVRATLRSSADYSKKPEDAPADIELNKELHPDDLKE